MRRENGEGLTLGGYAPSAGYLLIKRAMDLLLAGAGLLLLLPVFLILALAVKAEDGGPVFYRQRRLTQHGREFTLLKFRSMCVDAERDGVPRLSEGDGDVRVTRVGRRMRRYHLDELPQLLCVLKGDMSLCGPRPERPELAARVEAELPEFRLRLQAKAGLTGYAQVYGTYDTPPAEKLRMDLLYLSRPSLGEDMRLLLATLRLLWRLRAEERREQYEKAGLGLMAGRGE